MRKIDRPVAYSFVVHRLGCLAPPLLVVYGGPGKDGKITIITESKQK